MSVNTAVDTVSLSPPVTRVNCYDIFDAAMPFGGYKQSGWGRDGR